MVLDPNNKCPLSKQILSCPNVKIGNKGTCWKSVAELELDCIPRWQQGCHQCIWFFSRLDTGEHHILEAWLGLEACPSPWNMRRVLCHPSPRLLNVSVCVFSLLLPWWLEAITDTRLTEGGNSLGFWTLNRRQLIPSLVLHEKDQHFVLSSTEISYWLEQHSLPFFLYAQDWRARPGVKTCLCHSLGPLSLHPSFLLCPPQPPLLPLSPSSFPPPFLFPLASFLPLILPLFLFLSLSPYIYNTIQICLRCTEKNSE